MSETQFNISPDGEYLSPFADLLNGLLLPAVLGGPPTCLSGQQGDTRTQHLNAATHLEARHIFLQRKAVLPAHHHDTQQVRKAVPRWESALFLAVSRPEAQTRARLLETEN